MCTLRSFLKPLTPMPSYISQATIQFNGFIKPKIMRFHKISWKLSEKITTHAPLTTTSHSSSPGPASRKILDSALYSPTSSPSNVSVQLTPHACFWTVGGRRSTWWEPTHTQVEYADPSPARASSPLLLQLHPGLKPVTFLVWGCSANHHTTGQPAIYFYYYILVVEQYMLSWIVQYRFELNRECCIVCI